MGKLEGIIKSEMVRLAKRETEKLSLPLRREVRILKGFVSRLGRSVSILERLVSEQRRDSRKRRIASQGPSEEASKSRFSARLIRNLRKRLGITQKEMAILAGVTVGAIHQWEKGTFEPRETKKGILMGLRKLGRRAVRKLLEEKAAETGEKKTPMRREKVGRK